MTAFFEHIFSTIFGDNVILATILIAIVPIIELKGAIPFSMSAEVWGASALGKWSAFGYGLLGSSIVVPILALVYVPIIRWLKSTKLLKKLGERIDRKVGSKKDNIENKSKGKRFSMFFKILGVFLFVAFPLPFTGVWTGTCLAVVLGLSFPITCLVVIVGNVIAGLIITLLSSIVPAIIFFYIFIGLVLVVGAFMFVKSSIVRRKEQKDILAQKDNVVDTEVSLDSAIQEQIKE